MDYIRIYQNIIDNARSRDIQGKLHSHHIQPRAWGGDDSHANLVSLTVREHILVHTILSLFDDNQWYSVKLLYQSTNIKLPTWKRRKINRVEQANIRNARKMKLSSSINLQ